MINEMPLSVMKNQVNATAGPENNMHGQNYENPEFGKISLCEKDLIRFSITPDTLKRLRYP